MPTISRSALVEHSASDMYQLVCDIAAYPEFLPWCDAARVDEQTEQTQTASVTIGKYFAQSEFTTNNMLVPDREIAMQLVDGPFHQLRGLWKFTPLSDEACKIELEVDFEFASPVVARVISASFNSVCDTIVTAFIKRADGLAANAGRNK